MDNNHMMRIIDTVKLELDDWARWQRKDKGTRHLNYPSRSAGMQSGYRSKEWGEVEEEGDLYRVLTINAIIENMSDENSDSYSPIHKSAIYACYLGTTIRFPRGNYKDLVAEALMIVYEGMKREGLYIS